MNRAFYSIVYLFILSIQVGCSLMGLGEFDTEEFQTNEPCDELNQQNHIDRKRDCMVYQYAKEGAGCELRMCDWDDDGFHPAQCAKELPSGTEIDCDDSNEERNPQYEEKCDGIDNNCNLVIDEANIFSSDSRDTIVGIGSVQEVYYTHGRDGKIGVIYQKNDNAFLNIVESDSRSATPEMVSYISTIDQDDPEISQSISCYQTGTNGTPVQATCDFTHLSADRLRNDEWLVAAINTHGPGDGQVRIGYIDKSEGNRQVILRGPEQHSNIYLGVDPDLENNQSTGNSRSGENPSIGASHPALAALEPDSTEYPQALVAWIADSVERNTCDNQAVDIEVIGVWFERISSDGIDLKWTNATNNGIQQRLGQSLKADEVKVSQTKGIGHPAIVATERQEGIFQDEGYFLAHGNAQGSVSLYFIPVFDDPELYEYSRLNRTKTIRQTAPLNLDPDESMAYTTLGVESDENPDHVAIALGKYDFNKDQQEIGLVWQQGCQVDRVKLWFSVATFTEGNPGSFEHSEPIQINSHEGTHISTPAAIAYVSEGFIEPGFERDGKKSNETDTGGWLIVWSEGQDGRQQIKTRRILDLDHRPITIESEEGFLAFIEVDHTASDLALYKTENSDDYRLDLIYRDADDQKFVGTGLLCTPF